MVINISPSYGKEHYLYLRGYKVGPPDAVMTHNSFGVEGYRDIPFSSPELLIYIKDII